MLFLRIHRCTSFTWYARVAYLAEERGERVRHLFVNGVGVLRESVQDSAHGSGVEEAHGRAQHAARIPAHTIPFVYSTHNNLTLTERDAMSTESSITIYHYIRQNLCTRSNIRSYIYSTRSKETFSSSASV